MGSRIIALCALLLGLVVDTAVAQNRSGLAIPISSRSIPEVASMSLLESFFEDGSPGLLLLLPSEPSLGLYRYRNQNLEYVRRTTPLAYTNKAVTHVSDGERLIVVGYEYQKNLQGLPFEKGRKAPKDRVSLVAYNDNFTEQTLLFEEFTDKGQIHFLTSKAARLFVHFSHAEDYAKGGFLEGSPPNFRRIVAGRWQYAVDQMGEIAVVGSPHSDFEERARELQAFENNIAKDLPSLRGVSALRFVEIDSNSGPKLLVADGLPNVAHKRTRPELALVHLEGTARRQHVYTGSAMQSPLSRIEGVSMGRRKAVLVQGRTLIMILFPEAEWRSSVVYRKTSTVDSDILDFAVLESTNSSITFAVLDGGVVQVMQFRISGNNS